MTDLVDEKVGNAEVKLSFVGGQLVIEGDYNYAAGATAVVQKINAKLVLDAIGNLGTVEKDIISILEAALFPVAPVATAPSA